MTARYPCRSLYTLDLLYCFDDYNWANLVALIRKVFRQTKRSPEARLQLYPLVSPDSPFSLDTAPLVSGLERVSMRRPDEHTLLQDPCHPLQRVEQAALCLLTNCSYWLGPALTGCGGSVCAASTAIYTPVANLPVFRLGRAFWKPGVHVLILVKLSPAALTAL